MLTYKQLKKHKLLLDTHIWIWLMLGDEKIKSSFKNHVENQIENENILISPISIWEVGMLVEKKKIEIQMDCLDWIEQALYTTGIVLAPITPRIAIQSTRLPGTIHSDPADRILIATSYENNAVLVTHDQKLIKYGEEKFISVHDPCV